MNEFMCLQLYLYSKKRKLIQPKRNSDRMPVLLITLTQKTRFWFLMRSPHTFTEDQHQIFF